MLSGFDDLQSRHTFKVPFVESSYVVALLQGGGRNNEIVVTDTFCPRLPVAPRCAHADTLSARYRR